MSSKYSPRVRPNVRDAIWRLAAALNANADAAEDQKRRDKDEAERAERMGIERERLEMDRINAGSLPGPRPTIQPSEHDPFVNGSYESGMQRAFRERNAATMGVDPNGGSSLAGNMKRIMGGEPDLDPEVAALPGQFIPERGGFTPRAILRAPIAPRLPSIAEDYRAPERSAAPIHDPQTFDLPNGRHFDPRQTQRAREQRSEDERSESEMQRHIADLTGLGLSELESRVVVRNPSFLSQLRKDPHDAWIAVEGSRFPNTAQGQKDAIAWKERISAAGRAPDDEEPRGARRTLQRQTAFARIDNMLSAIGESGEIQDADIARVADAMQTYPEFRGVITRDEVVARAKQRQSRPNPETEELRRGIISQLGRAPANGPEQDALDQIVKGGSPSQILRNIRAAGQRAGADSTAVNQVVQAVEVYLLPLISRQSGNED